MNRMLIVVTTVLVALLGTPHAHAQGAGIEWDILTPKVVSKQVILEADADSFFTNTRAASTNLQKVAYTISIGEKRVVVLDGTRGKSYDSVGFFVFSPDSSRFAYVGKVNEKFVPIVDGVEWGEYDGVREAVFSPDSKSVAYVVQKGDVFFVISDLKEGSKYDGIGPVRFSPDGKSLAYPVAKGNSSLVVVDGEDGPAYDVIATLPVFSTDGKRIAYGACRGAKRFIVLDGKELKPYDGVAGPIFSPDGKRFAYVAQSGSEQFAVVDGVEGKHYKGIRELKVVFSPNGQHVAYVATENPQEIVDSFLVLDGKEWERHKAITSQPVFSPNSERIAFSASLGEISSEYAVVDGKRHEEKFYSVVGITFSPDSEHVAYLGAGDFQIDRIVVDGQPGEAHQSVQFAPKVALIGGWWEGPRFISEDTFCYLAQEHEGGKTRVFLVRARLTRAADKRQNTPAPPATAPQTPPVRTDLPAAEKIFEMATEAMGGQDALDKLESYAMKITMELHMGQGTMNMENYWAKPNKSLSKQIIPGMGEIAMGFDGKVGWQHNPMTGGYQLLDEEQVAQMKSQANMQTMHVQIREEFEQIDTIDQTDFGGRPCYKLRCVDTDDPEAPSPFLFFDVESHLSAGLEVTDDTPAGPMTSTITFKDWREAGGMKTFRSKEGLVEVSYITYGPGDAESLKMFRTMLMVIRMEGMETEMEMKMKVTSIEVNNVDPKLFELPEEVKKLVAERDQPATRSLTNLDFVLDGVSYRRMVGEDGPIYLNCSLESLFCEGKSIELSKTSIQNDLISTKRFGMIKVEFGALLDSGDSRIWLTKEQEEKIREYVSGD